MSIDVFFNNFASYVAALAALIVSLTTIGGALMWVYQKTFGKAKEKRQEQQNAALEKAIKESNQPLTETLEGLNQSINRLGAHHEKLDLIAEKNQKLLDRHDERLDNHHSRLIVVETKLGETPKHVSYVETYPKDKED